jgi:hypothetical protein
MSQSVYPPQDVLDKLYISANCCESTTFLMTRSWDQGQVRPIFSKCPAARSGATMRSVGNGSCFPVPKAKRLKAIRNKEVLVD